MSIMVRIRTWIPTLILFNVFLVSLATKDGVPGVKITIQYMDYESQGKVDSGLPCNQMSLFNKKCSPKFNVAIDNGTDAVFQQESGVFQMTKIIDFGEDIKGIKNPIEIELRPRWPKLRLWTEVYHSGGDLLGDILMSKMVYRFPEVMPKSRMHGTVVTLEGENSQSGAKIDLIYFVECLPNSFGPYCGKYCKTEGDIYCDPDGNPHNMGLDSKTTEKPNETPTPLNPIKNPETKGNRTKATPTSEPVNTTSKTIDVVTNSTSGFQKTTTQVPQVITAGPTANSVTQIPNHRPKIEIGFKSYISIQLKRRGLK